MKIQPIKLINTLNKKDIKIIKQTNNEWITELLSEEPTLTNLSKKTNQKCSYILDENNNIIISKSKNSNTLIKTTNINNILFSFITRKGSPKISTFFMDTFDKLPTAIKKRFFPKIKTNSEIVIDFQKTISTDGKINNENIILKSAKGTGYINRTASSILAKVTDNQNNLLYLGSIQKPTKTLYEDVKKDIFSILS